MPTSISPSARRTAAKSSSSERPQFVTGRHLLIAAGVILVVTGVAAFWFWPREDVKADLDRQIAQGWMVAHRPAVDALEFFENGGFWENRPGSDAAKDIDQKFVIPLIKKLKEKHQLKVLAIPHREDARWAMAVIAEAPTTKAARNEVRATILETVDAFQPGLLWMNWSYKWVSLDFFDEEEVVPFKDSGSYEKLDANQRRME